MVFLELIYQTLIGPLELFFEVLFSIAIRFLEDPGLSIIFLSLAMNFLVLPLYRRADAMQEEERDRALSMKPWVDHIKKTFKGDEQFMMLQTYYRQVGYKQTDALKGSLSLLLEIPFFIAAYHFLSNLSLLRGVPFGPISDLGAQDALISIGGFSINLLPLLMTAINVVSAAIYMKGFPVKNKVQMYGIAVIFLLLLYNSPSGLVFYWTLNNVFSLVKNLFYKMKNPKKVLIMLASAVGIALLIVILFVSPMQTARKQFFLIACVVLLQLPLLHSVLKKHIKLPEIKEATKADDRTFLFGCLFLALLTGVLIPVLVIQASPAEFVDMANYRSPLWYLLDSLALSLGTFVIWFSVFYHLATPKGRSIFGVVVWAMSGCALVNYLFFGTQYGNLSSSLQFDTQIKVSSSEMIINGFILLVVCIVLYVVWKKRPQIVRIGYLSMCVAMVAMSVYGVMGINSELEGVKSAIEISEEDSPHHTLSKSGNNVVIIMLDRAISYYFPYIMAESPDIAKQFAGFTYYPNTVSYGIFTNVGAPGLYGGYEYTPEAMNDRDDIKLADKHDEALKVMPVLFSRNGFDVTVFDPTYAGYTWVPDLGIYDEYPNINKYITMNGRYSVEEVSVSTESNQLEALLSRDFFCYSLFKISPLALQPTLYDKGMYNAAESTSQHSNNGSTQVTMPQEVDGISKGVGMNEDFVKSYAVLEHLCDIVDVSQDAGDTFLMMSNDATHAPQLLQEPEYIPSQVVDNVEFDSQNPGRYSVDGSYLDLSHDTDNKEVSKHMHYQVNYASLREVGEWLDYLRDNDVYDNTRIIIVSDHGRSLYLRDELTKEIVRQDTGSELNFDLLTFNCLLLVKDFGSKEFKVDNRFMTNADTPTLALDGLVDKPKNPFTGKSLNDSKKDGGVHLLASYIFQTDVNNGNKFLPGSWFSVRDNVFDVNNWDYLGNY